MSNEPLEQRRDYTANTLSRSQLNASPVEQFRGWLAEARDAKIIDATAMALGTADASGQPHSRIVLLKHFDVSGFGWYTYQESNKGTELVENSKACILFYWRELERQVRVEGTVSKMNPSDADEYFYSRPEGSRFSAAVSVQSSVVESRQVLEAAVAELHKQHPDGNVPRPAVWGGYRLKPQRFEFWQGRSDRLHDRFVYTLSGDNSSDDNWGIDRLSP